MKVNEIVRRINELVSNSSSFKLNYNRLKFFIDSAVDTINIELLTEYPTIDEYWSNNINYWSILIGLGIVPEIISNVETTDDVWFNTKYNKIYYGSEPVEQVVLSPEFKFPQYLYVQETYKFYELIDGVYVEKEYNVITEMPNDFDYNVFPDRYIRSCVIYHATALYLEEEDELESQYQTYKAKAMKEIANWKKQHYSMYECDW